MKSRTSFFNPTVFRKNLTRFAPAWAVYTILLLLGVTIIAGEGTAYYRCSDVADMVIAMVFFNLCYAFVLGQLLFGDLFHARMCNMIHAMPLRRETLFVTNAVSALAFALVPNLLVSLITLPLLGSGWIVSLYWFAACALQFLFFFGTAVFSVMLSGTRLAMTAVYGLIHFLSLLLLWFAQTLFAPLMFGIRVLSTPFYMACPTYQMMNFHRLIDVHRANETPALSTDGAAVEFYTGNSSLNETVAVTIGEGWGYTALCALIGLVLMVIALELYRRRRLEAAGDFMAVRAAEPVFLVLFALSVGAFFQLYSELFGTGTEYLFLAAGIVVGFFGGLMLLRKTVRVFQLKSFRNLGILGACIALTLVLTWLDPLGFSMRVPETEDISSVRVGTGYANSDHIWNDVRLEAPEDIEAIRQVHRYAIGEGKEDIFAEGDSFHYASIGIEYQLKDGSVLSRYYCIPVNSSAGEILRIYSSSIECVANMDETEFLALERKIYNIYTNYDSVAARDMVETLDIGSLLEAILADCKAGNMAQEWSYHEQYGDHQVTYLQLDYVADDGFERGISLEIFESCENTLRWLEENGLYEP